MYNNGNSSKNVTGASVVDGTIANADIDASAAIATSKLSGAVTSITSHGLSSSATTDTTDASNIGSGTLPNARLSAVPTSSLTGAVTSIASHGLASSATTDTTDASNIGSGTLPAARIATDGLSGDKIDGGTISNFASTGIDDNATSTAIIIDSSENISLVGKSTNTGYDTYLKIYGNDDPVANVNRWAGLVVYNNGGNNVNELAFFTGAGDGARTEQAKLGTSGNLMLQGNISFNGDTAAANALDDYEEGSWTPVFNGVTVAYSSQNGSYTKIGNLVHCVMDVNVSSLNNADVSTISIGGLPYTAASNSQVLSGGPGSDWNDLKLLKSTYELGGWWVEGTSMASTSYHSQYAVNTYADCNTSGVFKMSFTYRAA